MRSRSITLSRQAGEFVRLGESILYIERVHKHSGRVRLRLLPHAGAQPAPQLHQERTVTPRRSS